LLFGVYEAVAIGMKGMFGENIEHSLQMNAGLLISLMLTLISVAVGLFLLQCSS
jgi:hypothetical protein